MLSIFLSHATEDRPFVQRLADCFRQHGIDPWIDQAALRPGDPFPSKIGDAIYRADYFAVVISPASMASGWVNKELEIAFNREIALGRVFVLPIVIEHCDVPPFLTTKHFVDCTQTSRADHCCLQLLEVIKNPTPLSENIRVSPRAGSKLTRWVGMVGSVGLIVASAWFWTLPPVTFWQSSPRLTVAPQQNTRIERFIHSIGTAPLSVTDTLVWQFQPTRRVECADVEIVSPVVRKVDWEPAPEVEQVDDRVRNFRFSAFPPRRVAVIGVIVRGTPPQHCLRLDLLTHTREANYTLVEGSLLLARLRTNPYALVATIFGGLLIVAAIGFGLRRLIQQLQARR